ncbi:MAG: pilus assembly protein [Chloroflexi bacterium]|nr:pilus assembly protein [Chloroflexota bacterium]
MQRPRNHGELGQGLVEFAVIFPIFLIFVLGILDLGIAVQQRATLQHAAREGARFAATRDNSDGGTFVMDRTIDQAKGLVEETDVCITYEDIDGGEIDPGDAVDVEIEYNYEPFILRTIAGFFQGDVPDIDMTVTGSARLEKELDDTDGLCP